jgi:hypothetical protein
MTALFPATMIEKRFKQGAKIKGVTNLLQEIGVRRQD